MWIHFNFKCDVNMQIRLHKIFRLKISEWTKSKLIDGEVLTYHFEPIRKPNDSLYLCLNIPSVKSPHSRSALITQETATQIPKEINSEIGRISLENLANPLIDKLEKLDYEMKMQINDAPRMY